MCPDKAVDIIKAIERVVGPSDREVTIQLSEDGIDLCVRRGSGNDRIMIEFGNLRGLPWDAVVTGEDVVLLEHALAARERRG